MRKYMKYEIKGTYKFILGILAIVIIASTIIQLNVLKKLDNPISLGNSNGVTGFGAILLIISILVIFGAFLTAVFYIIGSFRKELYEDRGYLTFTLPLTGNQILASKLIVSMLWYAVLGLGIILYNVFLTLILDGGKFIEGLKQLKGVIGINLISFGIIAIISVIMTLILIYFSIALSRVSIRNKRIGGIWFIIFIVLNSLMGFLTVKVSEILPYYLNLDSFKILHYYDLNMIASMNGEIGSLILMGNNLNSYVNIFGILIQIVVIIAGFLGTGYLMENKIDL